MAVVDPIHQFEIRDLFPIAKIGNTEIAFTNSAAYMFVAVALITAFLVGGTARRGLVPGRVQSMVDVEPADITALRYGDLDFCHRFGLANWRDLIAKITISHARTIPSQA